MTGKRNWTILGSLGLCLLLVSCSALADRVTAGKTRKGYVIQNGSLRRSLAVQQGKLVTTEIANKRADTVLTPTACPEFRLRLSQGTHTTDTDVVLTSDDFTFFGFKKYNLSGKAGKGMAFTLQNTAHQLTVTVHYELVEDEFYLRKYLEITSGKPVTLERIDVDAVAAEDASQPYTQKLITARGPSRWKPGLGQPLFTTESATFWGTEFPAAYNYVENQMLYCGYLWGRQIEPNQTYKTYASVVGMSDDAEFNSDAFYEYIENIRVRPLRLRVQYNSWFDYGGGVNRDKFIKSVAKVYQELTTERGCKPFQSYVIDDGWQDVSDRADWNQRAWPVNGKFDPKFADSFKAVKNAESELGLWLSPGCNFGARRIVPKLKADGYEALSNWMSLAGPKYMGALGDRMVELTEQGVSYFKLDGLFGHLNTRDFDLYGDKHGFAYMPQLELDGFRTDDKRLNDAKYDELKTYYLVAGSEKLMDIFGRMHKVNPEVYIVISNGAWLSPWWMMHCDAVWMINAGDAAGGSNRTQELVYRDGVYHEIWETENTHYPMNSLFNHEPKKTKTGESDDVFRDYLYMNLSRGTGFVELYIKTFNLAERDWQVVSEGLHWVHDVFPLFERARMHGGDPRKSKVYGYTGWNADRGYLSIHNPSDQPQTYTVTLDRKFGLLPDSGTFNVSSPIQRCTEGLKKQYSYGDKITFELKPQEIIILNFDKQVRDWKTVVNP